MPDSPFTPVDPNAPGSPDTVANALFGAESAIDIQSLTLIGGSQSISLYDGSLDLGIGAGVLLTTGGIPATENTSGSAGQNLGLPGDADLTGIVGANTFDASSITITFDNTDPTVTGISFQIQFGTEEFPEYVDQFADVAAVFINGINFALFNHDQDARMKVTSDNVDAGYFNANDEGQYQIEYDGVTGVITVRAPIQLGENTIKIAIADSVDHIYDSGLFVSNFQALAEGDCTGGVTYPDIGEDNSGNNLFTGTNCVDNIDGGNGNDILYGLSGDDTMRGGEGDNALYGGNGNDLLISSAGHTQLFGDAGNDNIIAVGFSSAYGGAGDDRIILSTEGAPAEIVQQDGLLGGTGVDTLAIAPGAVFDVISFNAVGAGFEKVQFYTSVEGSDTGNTISFGGALTNDADDALTLNGNGGNDTLTGMDDASKGDTINGGEGDDTIYGGLGGDQLTGGTGVNTLNGGGGADTIHADQGGTDTVDAGAGNDTVFFQGTINSPNQIQGGPDIDTLSLNGAVTLNAPSFNPGAQGFEFVTLEIDNVTITGNGIANVIDFSGVPVSGPFTFRLAPAAPFLTIDGAGGDDTITGSNLGDHLIGGAGNNTLYGLDGDDTLDVSGSSGTNTLNGGAGDDILIGGSGDDTLNGGDGNDTLYGGGGPPALNGINANHPAVLNAGGGHVILNGGNGNDTIHADQGGTYTVAAGAGNDTVFFEGAIDSANQIKGGPGNDTLKLAGDLNLHGASFNSALKGFETVKLLGDIVITGDDHANIIDLSGFAASAPPGSFLTIDGAGDDDMITGSKLRDHITGGAGQDTLVGGAGADTFIFNHPGDSSVGADHRDSVDFRHADHDRIDLSAMDADTTKNGNQDFHLVGGGNFSGSAGELIQFVDSNGHTIVAGDVNGDGSADFEIELTRAVTLVNGDFVF